MSRPLRVLFAIAVSTILAATALGGPVSASADENSDQAKVTYIRGAAVRAGNGAPIPGVLVTVRDIDDLSVIASDVTDSRGVYVIDGLRGEEFAVKFNGRTRGYETGFLACSNAVVPTWGEACSHGTGNLGKARLQHL